MITVITTLVVYYTMVITIGFFRFRKQSVSEYITAPNSTGFVPLTLSLLGTIVGGGMFLGITQLGFDQGIIVFTLGVAYLIGFMILGLLAPSFRQYAREKEVTTLFGVLDIMYPPRGNKTFSLSAVFAWLSFVVFLLMLAVQFVAIGTFY